MAKARADRQWAGHFPVPNAFYPAIWKLPEINFPGAVEVKKTSRLYKARR
ncbi:hypothetical protein [Antrihabitans cavernicola]|nr:hypothetical protein [Spelaeibacter cavernicola]